jgi:hypothetical protein
LRLSSEIELQNYLVPVFKPYIMAWDKYNRLNGGVAIDFYPNTLDNIFWSKEGIIAVGGSDHVSLFVSIPVLHIDYH